MNIEQNEFQGCMGIDIINVKFTNEKIVPYFIKLDLDLLYDYTDIKFKYSYIYIIQEHTTEFIDFNLNIYVYNILSELVKQKSNENECINFLKQVINNKEYYGYIEFRASYGGVLKLPWNSNRFE